MTTSPTRPSGTGAATQNLPRQRSALNVRRRMSLQAVAHERRADSLRTLPLVLVGLDLVMSSVGVVLATVLLSPFHTWLGGSPDHLVPGLAVAEPLVLITWIVCIGLVGGYDGRILGAGASEFNRVVRGCLACAAAVGIGCYMVRFDLSRGWFALTFLIGTAAVLLGRLVLRSWLKRSRVRGRLRHRVLLVGDTAHIDSVSGVLTRETWLGFEVVGALAPPEAGTETERGIPVLGDLSAISGTAKKVGADVVLLAGGAITSPEHQRDIAWELEHDHAQLVIAPSVTDVAAERIQMRPVAGLPLIHIEKPRAAKAARGAKRLFDMAGASLILLLAAPVFAYCAFQVRRHDGGPVFFRQQRVGRHGNRFACLKFRTMAVDAETRLQEVLKAQGLEHGAFAKLKVDPRITKPGHWLRRFSLDELPQLLNVMRGEMSLVGPRPQTPREVEHYDGAMSRRLHVRPGMTGLWQVSGRSDLSVEESMRLDIYYVDNWSMIRDVSILARTAGAVVRSNGAY